jgi:hypothetical protein
MSRRRLTLRPRTGRPRFGPAHLPGSLPLRSASHLWPCAACNPGQRLCDDRQARTPPLPAALVGQRSIRMGGVVAFAGPHCAMAQSIAVPARWRQLISGLRPLAAVSQAAAFDQRRSGVSAKGGHNQNWLYCSIKAPRFGKRRITLNATNRPSTQKVTTAIR